MGTTAEIVPFGETKCRVLLVKDEPIATAAIAFFFGRQLDWEVDIARDGNDALQVFESRLHAGVIIDWNLTAAGPSGLEVCRQLRARSSMVALMVLGDRDALDERLNAFAAGADDYIARLVDPEEFLARAKALVRRSLLPPTDSKQEPQVARKDRILDRESGLVRGPSGNAQLTRVELRLLVHCESSGPTATSEAIATAVLGRQDQAARNLVHRHVANIRAKLRKVGLENSIVRGPLGYVLRGPFHLEHSG